MSDSIRSTTAAEPVGPYPHARRVGNMLFLSGIGPRVRGSRAIPGAVVGPDGALIDYSIEAEIRSCFDNIRAVLADAGMAWENIVDCQCFLTDMKRDWRDYNRVYAEYFPPGPGQPTRTTVEVSCLPTGGDTPIHFEIKVIAAR
ncbi:MAG: RidA family protein [Phycisphaeraceae bacterium]|nr:RidA family protein [Phycisphaerae bacterium]MBX3392669.1 RidA family protein [Phycisphaeraceae bacterium]HRJ49675.1 RidA family protein [Phycisphaerales bacterium]